ncbi:hypothetical protein GWK47_033629 [Chionoecetes opilio]|uniref:DUF7047 domain-containing protein n=1 Tax=Chionoecetes opilio TaxID=41210 RepID=A0A8J5CPH4_CHIOP|nr:hypothetical protein GWK47_033629 [Chionoecetes opilio]
MEHECWDKSLGGAGGLFGGEITKWATCRVRFTRGTVFSYCGKLVGHYPVCGWLRVWERRSSREESITSPERWDEVVADGKIEKMLERLWMKSVERPRARTMDVRGDKAKVWVDASSLALGVAVEIDGRSSKTPVGCVRKILPHQHG